MGKMPMTENRDTVEGRRAWLMSLPPAERLAEFRRLGINEPRPCAPASTRAATEEERARLAQLPPIERLADARRRGIA